MLSTQGQVTISNDGATIMKKLEIVHPAAKVLVDISLSQDAEVRTSAQGLVIRVPKSSPQRHGPSPCGHPVDTSPAI